MAESRYEAEKKRACQWCASGFAPSERAFAEAQAIRAEEAERKLAVAKKIGDHVCKRLADEYGVELPQEWADRVLAGEHDVPFPETLTGDTLDSLRRKLATAELQRDACRGTLALVDQERDELKYRLQTWNDVHVEQLRTLEQERDSLKARMEGAKVCVCKGRAGQHTFAGGPAQDNCGRCKAGIVWPQEVKDGA